MTKPNLPRRAIAAAIAPLCACALLLAAPAAAPAAHAVALPATGLAAQGRASGASAPASHQAPSTGSSPAKGAGEGESTPLNLGGSTQTVHSSGAGAGIVRTIVGLAIVIAVIFGLGWVLRQVKAGRDPHVGNAGLSSVAALTLSSGRSLHLVRAGSEYVLLGSAEHAVVPIHRYTEQEARDAGLPLVAEAPARGRRTSLRDGGERAPGRYDPTRIPSSFSELLERLREWTVRR